MGAGCSSNHLAEQGFDDVPSFKIVLVGDPEVGKSSVYMRYFRNQIDYSYRTTTSVSIENVVKKLNVPEHIVVSVAIWDLPGREEVDLRKSYYKDVDAAIVVVNIADQENVELAGTWRQDIHNHAVVSKKRVEKSGKGSKVTVEYEKADPSQIPVLLLGNKYDIIEEREALKEAKEDNEVDKQTSQPADKSSDETRNNENKTSHIADIPSKEDTHSNRDAIINSDSNRSGPREILLMRQSLEEDISGDEKEDASKDDKARRMQGDGNVTVWKYEEEHEQEVEIPEEVQRLEAAAEQHGFVGSVAVSAKNSDGGVHTAIQALIRHLLERKLKDKALQKMEAIEVKRHKRRRLRTKKTNPDDFQPLDKVDIEKIDKMFMQCNWSLSRVHETSLAYRQAVKQFKKDCLQTGIVEGPKCSVEDCVGGLKAAMSAQSLELMTQDKDGFLELVVQGEVVYDDDKSDEIKKIMDTFQSEVVVACQTILRDVPTADAELIRMDEKITDKCSVLWELADKSLPGASSPLTAIDKKRIQGRVDLNRARIRQAHSQATQNLQDVDGLYKKIKAAMLW